MATSDRGSLPDSATSLLADADLGAATTRNWSRAWLAMVESLNVPPAMCRQPLIVRESESRSLMNATSHFCVVRDPWNPSRISDDTGTPADRLISLMDGASCSTSQDTTCPAKAPDPPAM